jgi:hypothetical protein
MSRAIRASREQQFLLPPSMDDWLPTSHAVRFVADLVEELDLEGLGFHQSPGEEGRPHFAPDLLLGVWLFGWMERIRSSADQDETEGQPLPDRIRRRPHGRQVRVPRSPPLGGLRVDWHLGAPGFQPGGGF